MGYVLVAEGRSGEAAAHLELALSDPKLPDRAAVERLLDQARQANRGTAPAAEKASAAPRGPAQDAVTGCDRTGGGVR